MNEETMRQSPSGKRTVKKFFTDVLHGCCIGVAFIIPGFSGGSVAAILGIYETLVNAIANIFKDFKKNLLTLLPIFFGMIIGIVSLLFPIGWALENFPLPTVSLFVGLALGGLPSITDKLGKKKIKAQNFAAFLIPLLAAATISFLPTGSAVDLFDLNFGGYVLLFIIGIIGSSALVVPGISGSMLLLIFGYYDPIVTLITDHFFKGKDVGVSFSVLGCTALGIAVGFIAISKIMSILLKKCPRGTYFAILGFIIGSVPTIYISTAKDAGYALGALPTAPIYWIMCAVMLAIGVAISLALIIFSKKIANNK